MLNKEYPYYKHPEFEAATDDEYESFNDADKALYAKQEADFTRYIQLKERVIDLLANQYTLTRLAIDTQPIEINNRRTTPDQWENSIKKWMNSFKECRSPSIYTDQPSLAEVIENQLTAFFSDFDRDESIKNTTPIFVGTSVSRNIMNGLLLARNVKELVEIKTPPGSGKTFTADHFLTCCRKSEGFNSPVWKITLRETNNNLKNVLIEILHAMREQQFQGYGGEITSSLNEYSLANEIEQIAIKCKDPLLIIDEGQNLLAGLKGTTIYHGLNVINELRTFTDKKLMGIAILSNGEIYEKARKANAVQILRRMEAWFIDAGKISQEDVELIMRIWNVSGQDARKWCIAIGTGPGGIGLLTHYFRAAYQRYGEINFTVLSSMKRV